MKRCRVYAIQGQQRVAHWVSGSATARHYSSAPPSSPPVDGMPVSANSAPLTSSAMSGTRVTPVTCNATLDGILRVDHAGEYGAQCIYNGQLDALRLKSALSSHSSPLSAIAAILQSVSSTPTSASAFKSHIDRTIAVIADMRSQEVEHLNGLSALVPRHRCRPTALLPLWHIAGYTLGYATAMMGTRAAMACTVAVEEVITEHYNDQLRTLASDDWKQPGEQLDEAQQTELTELRALIRKNRDDEEHHRDVGIEHEAEQTPFYSVLSSAIKTGCQVAIAVAKKV